MRHCDCLFKFSNFIHKNTKKKLSSRKFRKHLMHWKIGMKYRARHEALEGEKVHLSINSLNMQVLIDISKTLDRF